MSGGNRDRSDMEIVSHSSVKQLRVLIENAGLSHAGVVEREELEALAKRALESDSEPEAEAAEIQELGLGGPPAPGSLSQSCRAPTITRRRVSLFKMQKKLASTVGDTKAGRTTLLKLIGEQGVEIIQSLKSAVTSFESREKAKELKKNTVKWIIKVALLWKRQSITRANSKVVVEQAQLISEIFCRVLETKPRGSRDVAPVVDGIGFLRTNMEQLLKPHSQPKNVAKLSAVLEYYGSKAFLEHLMNSPKVEQECTQISKNIKNVFTSPTDVYDIYDKQRDRIRYIDLLLNVSAYDCVNSKFPEVTDVFKAYLKELEQRDSVAKYLTNSICFIATTKEYRMVSSKTLLAPRAKTIYSKFIGPTATHPVLYPDAPGTNEIRTAIQGCLTDAKTAMFDGALKKATAQLVERFEKDVQHGYAPYAEFRKGLANEKRLLQKRVRTYRISEVSPPS